jgi:hypothetical protein
MKKAYQIDERRAIEKFRSHLLNDHGAIQMILPLAEIAQKLRNGVDPTPPPAVVVQRRARAGGGFAVMFDLG